MVRHILEMDNKLMGSRIQNVHFHCLGIPTRLKKLNPDFLIRSMNIYLGKNMVYVLLNTV